MKRFSWVGLITALLLTFSLLAPIVDGVGAADGEEEETPVPSVVEVVDETEVNADPPVEEIVEPPSDEETAEPSSEEITPPPADEVQVPEEAAGETPEPALEDQTPVVEETTEPVVQETMVADDSVSQDGVVVGEEAVDQAEPTIDISEAGSIKIFVSDQFGAPVAGAGFTIYPQEGETCSTTPFGGEQFTDSNGVTIFVGINPETTYCVFQTTVPGGYFGFAPDELIDAIRPADVDENDPYPLDALMYVINYLDGEDPGTGSLTVLKYYCEVPVLEVQRVSWDVFYYDFDAVRTAGPETSLECTPGVATFQLKSVSGSTEQTFQTSASGSFEFGPLAAGMWTLEELEPYGSGPIEFEVFENGTTTVVAQNFVNSQSPGALEVQKYFCESTTEYTEFLTGIQSSKDCEPGYAEFNIYFYKTGGPYSFATDSSGYQLLEGMPEGTHLLEEVSSGAQVEFTITPETVTSFTVVNYFIYVPSGSLSLEKVYCESETAGTDFILDPSGGLPPDCYRGAADFKIFPFKTGNPIPVSTDSNGYLTVTELPVGTHLLEEVQSGAQTEFTIAENETTSYRVVNRYVRQPAGDLYIEKIYCIAEEPGTTFTELGGGELSPDCHRGPASFKIYPFKTGDPIYVSTDANGYLLVPGLPVGTHLLEEVGSAATTEFTIVDLEQTDVGVINFYVPGKTGTVEIRKYFEFGDHAQTQLYVGDPGIWPPLPKTEDYYWLGNADFEIWPFGDESAKIEFSTGAGGVIVLTVPVTTQQTGPHIILEVASGKSATFEIDPDEKTIVKAVNMLVEKPGEPDKTEPTRAEEVASVGGLPVTGIGESSGYDPMTTLLGSLFALLAFAILKMHLVVPRRR